MEPLESQHILLIMRNSSLLLVIILLTFLGFLYSCQKKTSTESQPEFQQIFDGKTFTGWEGSKDFFRIEEGAIVAGALDRNIPKNQFLCTEKRYKDFDLRLRVKFSSKENNAGIQFRTERIPDHHEVIGYQADVGFIGERPIWANLYDESRRKIFLKEADPEKVLGALEVNGWNDYRILCKGAEITLWINGIELLNYTEEEVSISQSGVICVQIHSGVAAEAWYKDIQIQEL